MLLAVDTETEGLDWHDPPFCVTMATRVGEELKSRYFELSEPANRADAMQLLLDADKLIFHNAKFDIQKLILVGMLRREDLTARRIHDTEALAHLLDESRRKALKVLVRDLLGLETDEDTAIAAARREHKLKKADGYHLLPREIIIPYALKDAEFTYLLWERLYPELMQYDDLADLYVREMELSLVLLDMEARGMALDLDYLRSAVKEYADKILVVELDIRDIAGEDFNPNSPKQVVEWFALHGYELEGTAEAVLRDVDHDLARKILELRTLKKLHGTYLKPLLTEQRDGIIHPWFRQHGTKTGRMSSGGASE